jgi:hypothetical protein
MRELFLAGLVHTPQSAISTGCWATSALRPWTEPTFRLKAHMDCRRSDQQAHLRMMLQGFYWRVKILPPRGCMSFLIKRDSQNITIGTPHELFLHTGVKPETRNTESYLTLSTIMAIP